MAGNVFGSAFKITTFGESHGSALGVVIDGCPAGVKITRDEIQDALNRRRPGNIAGAVNSAVTSRNEADKVEILSGILDDVTEGTPIAMLIRNTSCRSSDYDKLLDTFRPGHADLTYFLKYGVRDARGGGRSSGRETAARVAAGAVAAKVLAMQGIKINAYTIEAAGIVCTKRDMGEIERNAMRACDALAAKQMMLRVAELRGKGDSAGGVVECVASGVMAGLGEPVFDKLDAVLSHAMVSIGAVKGIEFGAGFEAARMTGSVNNDAMGVSDGKPSFMSNNAGGILGGISRGDDIVFRVAVKPVPSIFLKQQTISWTGETFTQCDLAIEGRHDVCLCPRIVSVVEAMTALTLADMMLRLRSSRV